MLFLVLKALLGGRGSTALPVDRLQSLVTTGQYLAAYREVERLAMDPNLDASLKAQVFIAGVRAAAGLRDVAAEKHVATVSLPPMDPYAAQQISTLPVAPAFAALTDDQRRDYVRGMEAALAAYRTPDGRTACPFASWIVTATR